MLSSTEKSLFISTYDRRTFSFQNALWQSESISESEFCLSSTYGLLHSSKRVVHTENSFTLHISRASRDLLSFCMVYTKYFSAWGKQQCENQYYMCANVCLPEILTIVTLLGFTRRIKSNFNGLKGSNCFTLLSPPLHPTPTHTHTHRVGGREKARAERVIMGKTEKNEYPVIL